MSGKSVNFDDKKSTKVLFIRTRNYLIYMISKNESYVTKNSLKYFIGYNDDDAIRPLCIKLPQMIGYVKNFDSNKTMSFKISDSKLLKSYNKI